jgi:hypothetical protein
LRAQIETAKTQDCLSDTAKSLSMKREQQSASDQICVNRAIESNRLTADEHQRITRLESAHKCSETQPAEAQGSQHRISEDDRRLGRWAAL